ncbi:MAG: hypothetical protein SWO11_21715 [Thermodesulfobacteriota bacterium]|nr:hypothetical protein [Thermodesulfobacteriota bacterium]
MEEKVGNPGKTHEDQKEIPIIIVRRLFELMDLTALPEDIDFLLKLGAKPHTTAPAVAKTSIPEQHAYGYLQGLVKKGWI